MTEQNTRGAFLALAKDFYNLFHVKLSIYDQNRNMLLSYPDNICNFCTLLRTDSTLERRCICHDIHAFDMCSRSLQPYIYHCHMGLVEVAEPVVKDGVILGYLLFGQISDDLEKTLIRQRFELLENHVQTDELRRAINNIEFRTKETIVSMSHILEMCAMYIQLKDMFSVQKDSLSFLISEYIRQNLQNDIQIEKLCTHFGISRSALYLLSRKNFGMGITEYILSLRVQTAKALLKTTDLRTYEIARQVGFDDSNYFTKVFKRFTSMTPSTYKKLQGP